MQKQGIILDNGSHSIKVGLNTSKHAHSIPNAVMRTGTSKQVFVGDELLTTNTELSYASAKWWKRPSDRGIVVNWELEQKIWDIAFHRSFKNNINVEDLSFDDFTLLYTQTPLCPPMLQNVAQEVVFETYGFSSVYCCSPASLVLYNQRNKFSNTISGKSPCSIVIDSGYSYSHIMPFIGNQLIPQGIKRVNIGGKMMDNYLKEVISFRQWNVMDEHYLMSHIKEELCYVSLDFISELENAKKFPQKYSKFWVLPTTKADIGNLRNENTPKNAQMLRMNNERFSVPELLFNPSIIGSPQSGIVESIVQCVNSCPQEMHEALYSNILLSGGNANLPNFKKRIEIELRSLIPQEYDLNITLVENPITAAWEGGNILQNTEQYNSMCATKEQYMESGHRISDLFKN